MRKQTNPVLTGAVNYGTQMESSHRPHQPPPHAPLHLLSGVWVMSSAERGSEDHRTSQAMNSAEECDRNFHPEDGCSAAHLHRETSKTLPHIFQFLTGRHILNQKQVKENSPQSKAIVFAPNGPRVSNVDAWHSDVLSSCCSAHLCRLRTCGGMRRLKRKAKKNVLFVCVC